MKPAVPALALLLAACAGTRDPLPQLPRIILWAWDRPEHMSFLDPHAAGVAFLARTISWRDGQISQKPRYQPLELPPGAAVIAVIRLESGNAPLPGAAAIASGILEAAALPRIKAVQIDFDARLSERDWYATLLRAVHLQLRPNLPLTITALSSWCEGDPWIRNLPVADAVPMLFRMGPGEAPPLRDFSLPVCRASVGISTDEPLLAVPRNRRLFIFNPRPWTPETYRDAMGIARRLR